MKDDAKAFMILVYMKAESKALIEELLVVCDFLKCFRMISLILRQSASWSYYRLSTWY